MAVFDSETTVAGMQPDVALLAQLDCRGIIITAPGEHCPLSEILLLILDGIHRWSAYKVLGLTEIEAVLWQEQPLDYATCKDDMLLESARRNISHGDRLSQTDKRQVARDMVTRDPECHLSEELLAGSLGVTQQTVNNWIKDIRARQKASRDSTILRLNRLGWTQQKIADKVGIGRARVSGIAQGRDMPYIAGHLNMDLATAWATKLTGLKDQEKFKALGWGLRTWDQWYFNDCDDRFGTDWPGRIPAQLVAHTLFYFTDPGDLVMDPMAGGGVVPDVCLLFERKCRAFDLAPIQDRPEDVRTLLNAGILPASFTVLDATVLLTLGVLVSIIGLQIRTQNYHPKGGHMLQAKFSVEETQARFLNNFKVYGFKDKSAMLREAIEHFKKELELESLRKSAELYSEIYSEDDDLKELTETALNGWPE